jgi:hypothetical protein
MVKKIINWIFSPTKKYIVEDHIDMYSKIVELEEKCNSILDDIKKLKDENVGIINELYEMENRIESQIYSIQPVVYNIQQKGD